MDYTIRVVKTKVLISFAVTVKLICPYVFAYAKSLFSHYAAHIAKSTKLSTNTKYVESPEYKAFSFHMLHVLSNEIKTL